MNFFKKSRLTWLLFLLSGCATSHIDRVPISTPMAPKAIGPYSQAIQAGQLVFVSGQIPLDPKSGALVTGGIEEQTKRVLDNIQAILKEASTDLDHVVSTTVYLSDMGDFSKMNAVYATYFKNTPPARATIQAARLPKDVAIEIAVTAVK